MTIGLDPFRALRRHRQQWIHSAAHLTYPGADCNDTRGQPRTPSAEDLDLHKHMRTPVHDQDNSKSWKREASPWCGLGDATAASMQAPQARGAYYLDGAIAAAAI